MENVLKSLNGVVDAKADYVEGLATITYDPARIAPDQMVEAINTRTFFQANVPHPEGITPEASQDLNLRSVINGGLLLLLIGFIIWRTVARRRMNRAKVTGNRQEA